MIPTLLAADVRGPGRDARHDRHLPGDPQPGLRRQGAVAGDGGNGSGRIADVGPSLAGVVQARPLFGQGFGTRVPRTNRSIGGRRQILDDQWLTSCWRSGRSASWRCCGSSIRCDPQARATRARWPTGPEAGWRRRWPRRYGVSRRHVHLRRVRVHPGDVLRLHHDRLRRRRHPQRRSAADADKLRARRAPRVAAARADAARRTLGGRLSWRRSACARRTARTRCRRCRSPAPCSSASPCSRADIVRVHVPLPPTASVPRDAAVLEQLDRGARARPTPVMLERRRRVLPAAGGTDRRASDGAIVSTLTHADRGRRRGAGRRCWPWR